MKNYIFSQFFQFFSDTKTIKVKIILLIFLPLLFNIVNINESKAEKGKTFREIEEKKGTEDAAKKRLAQLIKETEDGVYELCKISDTFIKEYRRSGVVKATEMHLEVFLDKTSSVYTNLDTLSEEYKTSNNEINNTFNCVIQYSGSFVALINFLKEGDTTKEDSIQMLKKEVKMESERCKKEAASLKRANFIRKKKEKPKKKAKKTYTPEELQKKRAALKLEIEKDLIAMYNGMYMFFREYKKTDIFQAKSMYLEKILEIHGELNSDFDKLDSLPQQNNSDKKERELLLDFTLGFFGSFLQINCNLSEEGDKKTAQKELMGLYKLIEEAKEITAAAGIRIPQETIENLKESIKELQGKDRK